MARGLFQIGLQAEGATSVTYFEVQSLKEKMTSLSSSDSGRADDGTMYNTWILDKISSITVTFPPLTESEANTLISIVQGKNFYCTFTSMQQETLTMYAYVASTEGTLLNDIANGVPMWQGFTFSIVNNKGN